MTQIWLGDDKIRFERAGDKQPEERISHRRIIELKRRVSRTLHAAFDLAGSVEDVPGQLRQGVWRVVVQTHQKQSAVYDAQAVTARRVDAI